MKPPFNSNSESVSAEPIRDQQAEDMTHRSPSIDVKAWWDEENQKLVNVATNAGKGAVAGWPGFVGDIGEWVVKGAQSSSVIPFDLEYEGEFPGSTNWFGRQLGADINDPAFQAGTFFNPEGLLKGAARLGGKIVAGGFFPALSLIGEKGAINLPQAWQTFKQAKQLQQQGKTNQEIWQETRWVLDPQDNLWKYDLPSWEKGKLKENFLMNYYQKYYNKSPGQTIPFRGKVSDIYDYSDLFRAYPEIADIPLEVDINKALLGPSEGSFKSYLRATGEPRITVQGSIAFKFKNPLQDIRGTMEHELEHAIQWLEEFPGRGTNTEQVENALRSYDWPRTGPNTVGGVYQGPKDLETMLALEKDYVSKEIQYSDVRQRILNWSLDLENSFYKSNIRFIDYTDTLPDEFQNIDVNDPLYDLINNVIRSIQGMSLNDRTRLLSDLKIEQGFNKFRLRHIENYQPIVDDPSKLQDAQFAEYYLNTGEADARRARRDYDAWLAIGDRRNKEYLEKNPIDRRRIGLEKEGLSEDDIRAYDWLSRTDQRTDANYIKYRDSILLRLEQDKAKKQP